MIARYFLLVVAVVSATLLAPRESIAVNVILNDGCKSLTGSTSGTVSVDGTSPANGAITVGQFTVPYSVIGGPCDTAAADNKPRCTVSASRTLVEPGTTVALYANCTTPAGQAVTSYAWSAPPGGPAPSTSSSTSTLTFAATANGAYTYAVSATNAYGAGPVSGPVTILVGSSSDATAAPNCVVTITPAQVAQGDTATAQVVCQPQADTYTWTNPAGAPTASGAGGTLAFAGTAVNFYTYAVKGKRTGSQDGPTASATVNVKSNGTCAPGGVHYEYTIPQFQVSPDIGGGAGTIAAFPFQTAGAVQFQWTTHTQYNYYWYPVTSTWAISQCKGDFTTPQGPCKQVLGGQYGGTMNVYTGGNAALYCVIQPNTQYYLNVRIETCTEVNGVCGYRMYRN